MNFQPAIFNRFSDYSITNTVVSQYFFYRSLILYLNDNTRIFGKKYGYQRRFSHIIQIHCQTAGIVSKTHFKQCSNHSAAGNVVSGEYHFLVYQLLNGIKCSLEIFSIIYCRSFVTKAVECLSQRRSSEFMSVKRKIDVKKMSFFVVHNHGTDCFSDVRNFCSCRNNDRSG